MNEVAIGNHTDRVDVILPSRTVIGSIEPVEKVIEIDKPKSPKKH